jgi:phosphomannomutase
LNFAVWACRRPSLAVAIFHAVASSGVAKIASNAGWLVVRHTNNHPWAGAYDAEKRQSSLLHRRAEPWIWGAQASIAKVLAVYEPEALQKDQTDGVSLEFDAWRFNLRASNTEPVVRLNIESRGDPSLVATKLDDITRLLQS